jgi:hypothetical protein
MKGETHAPNTGPCVELRVAKLGAREAVLVSIVQVLRTSVFVLVLEYDASEIYEQEYGRAEEDRRRRRPSPLIKPDVQISRIRLTKGISARGQTQAVDAKLATSRQH